MKLASYVKDGEVLWGRVDTDVQMVYPYLYDRQETSGLLDFIKAGNFSEAALRENFDFQKGVPLDQVKLCAPLHKPLRNIFCVGKNYVDHILEVDKGIRKELNKEGCPAFFTKATGSVNGPYDEIPLHKGITSQIDYEAELAVVIGKRGTNISPEDVPDYIFGYTIINDVSARDLQRDHLQWFKGKSLDGFCPMGPWIVTSDEIQDPSNLDISCTVNGQLRQNSNTHLMIFNIREIVSSLSQGLTLEPGDVIATGTPSGVGMGFEPPLFLKQGDVVRIEIEKIGFIENKLG